jgi:hypothetical protein
MARRVGFVLVFLGLFLLFFALVERVYAYPRLKKAPLDQYSQPVDVKAGSDEVAVWDSFNSTVDTADQGVITATQERIALDRVTAQSVQCCGENPRHQGLTLKFPFDTRKTTYQFWDAPAQRALPAAFTRTERINGVSVYRFEQRIDQLDIGDQDIPGALAGEPGTPSVQTDVIYSNVKTIWVEPATGIIVKAQQDVTQVLRTPGGENVLTLIDAVLTYDEATVDANADDAAKGVNQLRILGTILPVAALALGLIALAAGLVLLRSPEGRRVARGERRPADAV